MSRALKVGLFGGTFDPIHNGHLALARAAQRRFNLDHVYFIPSGLPPHKSGRGMSPYLHRYTMVALACGNESRFVPSTLEAGEDLTGRKRVYSVDTVARVRRQLGRNAKLYFLMGADQFLTLPEWKGFSKLTGMCEFIVAARPGFTLAEARKVVPANLLPGTKAGPKDSILLRRGAVHLLRGLKADVSSSEIRRLVRQRRKIWQKKVPAAVGMYIESTALYRGGHARSRRKGAGQK